MNAYELGVQTGLFSAGPSGEVITQHFFDAAFAGRINENKIYKESYHCNIIGKCGLMEWMEEFMGYETDCYTEYTLLETFGYNRQVKIDTQAVVPQYPGTVQLHLDTSSQYVNGQFILPIVGNSLVLPNGILVKVTAVNQASATDAIITVQQRDTTGNTGGYTILAGSALYVLSGAEIEDCECPEGQFRFPDLPVETDLRMIKYGDKGEICGDALDKCQWLKIPFTDECGNVLTTAWYTEALQEMYRSFEDRKWWETMFNPFFGMIPILKARGLKWTPASASEITVADVRAWKKELDKGGITCKEFAVFAGRDLFSQWQQMLSAEGVTKLLYAERPLKDCGWLNLDYCGMTVEGLTLHIYEECNFSNGKMLGGANSIFPGSAVIIPMCARPACRRSTGRRDRGGSDTKMFSRVYFKSNDGKVWDALTDSNGIFGPRNTFGAGCRQHEWTIQTRFTNEIHCANWWGYMGL